MAVRPHPMTKSGFGEHLRREREMRGVSLEEIAGATRISTRFLDALEKEAWDRLPGGVFNRGFVRTVARFLGLEEESLLAEYALATRPPGDHAILSEPSPQPSAPRRTPWIALGMVSLLLALAGAGAYGWRWFSARRAELNAAASAVPAAPVPPGLPPVAPSWPAEPAPPTQPVPRTPPPTPSPWAALPQEAPIAPPSHPADELRLTVGADKQTYLTVITDDRQVFAGAILAGESRSFSAKSAVTVEAQDAGAIRLELNGQMLAPIGPLGQSGKLTIGRRDLKSEPGGHD
jgi:cytoskeletal protein RodZ